MAKLLTIAATLFFLCAGAQADTALRLPHIFGDHMVLQREKPVHVWGWASKDQTVSVSFGGQDKSTTTSADGKWQVSLDAIEANATGQDLTVTAGEEHVTLSDVLVGEVWLCGGQSNMEMRLRSSRDADVEIPCARYPGIRFIQIKPEGLPNPREDFPAEDGAGVWQTCTPETVGDCSGVAYFFGQRLHRRLDVPVGLINAAWGGTMAQHWVTRETLETLPAARSYLDDYDQKCRAWADGGGEKGAAKRYAADLQTWESLAKIANAAGEKPPGKPNEKSYRDPAQGRIPAGALNAMIMPMAGLSIRGALFYQGENNSFGDTWIPFQQTFPAVIADWRKLFRDDQLPFGIIQIAGWSTRRSMTYDMNHHTNVVREVQFNTWRATPDTGLIASFDANSNDSIHPGRKYPVGKRSARWALSTVYGITDAVRKGPLQWHGPVYQSMEKKADKIVVHFEKIGSDGLRLERADARGFYIAGADRVFHHALARVVGGRGEPVGVEVWSDEVPDPVAVRYASSNLPLGTLMNGKELPAFPFRTDTWPLKPHYGEMEYRVAPEKEANMGVKRFKFSAGEPDVKSDTENAAEKSHFDPVIKEIEGWKVHIDPKLLKGEHAEEGGRSLKMLASHLQRIAILMPANRLEEMRKLELWIEYDHPQINVEPGPYHPGVGWLTERGYDPRLVKKVHVTRAASLLERHQLVKHPAVILHELAHSYHDQILGFDDRRIKAAYEKAMAAGLYDEVLDHKGRKVRGYAATNEKEYFAEGTEAYFYRNDFYPFVKAELKLYDPLLHKLLEEIWGPLE